MIISNYTNMSVAYRERVSASSENPLPSFRVGYLRDKEGKLFATGKDGKRREVLPVVKQGQIGWATEEETCSGSIFISYQVKRINSYSGRLITRALVRKIAFGEMDVREDLEECGEEADLVKKAVTLGYAIRSGYAINHENFDFNQYPQYQALAPQPARRKERIRMLSAGVSEGLSSDSFYTDKMIAAGA